MKITKGQLREHIRNVVRNHLSEQTEANNLWDITSRYASEANDEAHTANALAKDARKLNLLFATSENGKPTRISPEQKKDAIEMFIAEWEYLWRDRNSHESRMYKNLIPLLKKELAKL